MTLWEFAHCTDGWKEANRAEGSPPPAIDDERMADLGIVGF